MDNYNELQLDPKQRALLLFMTYVITEDNLGGAEKHLETIDELLTVLNLPVYSEIQKDDDGVPIGLGYKIAYNYQKVLDYISKHGEMAENQYQSIVDTYVSIGTYDIRILRDYIIENTI